MNKNQKTEKIEQYEQAVSEATYAILMEHGKMPVPQVERLRKEMTGLNCQTIVLKNTLAKIVFERNGHEEICEYLAGPSMVFCGSDEISPVAKAIKAKLKEFKAFKVKAILFDGAVYGADDFQKFTDMPTRDEIRSKLLSVFKAPASQFVGILNPAPRMVGVLAAYSRKKAG